MDGRFDIVGDLQGRISSSARCLQPWIGGWKSQPRRHAGWANLLADNACISNALRGTMPGKGVWVDSDPWAKDVTQKYLALSSTASRTRSSADHVSSSSASKSEQIFSGIGQPALSRALRFSQ